MDEFDLELLVDPDDMEEFIRGLCRYEPSVYREKYIKLQYAKFWYNTFARWLRRGHQKEAKHKQKLKDIAEAFRSGANLTEAQARRLDRRKLRSERELQKAFELIRISTVTRNEFMRDKARLDRWFERERKFADKRKKNWDIAMKFEAENPGVQVYV